MKRQQIMTYKTNGNKEKGILLTDELPGSLVMFGAVELHRELVKLRRFVRRMTGDLSPESGLTVRELEEAAFVLEWLTEEVIMTDVEK